MNQHNHEHHHHKNHTLSHSLIWALMIATLFMMIEIAGGIWANSLALISDALHMFTDVGALILSLVVLKIAQRPRTPKMSYGHQRAEVLGALASALSLWILCGFLIYEAIWRFIYPEIVEGKIVFIIAVLGLLANLFMMKVLHADQSHSLNIRAAYLHVLGDLLGSIGVILSGVIIWFTGWSPIDPIITILFSLGIIYSSSHIIVETTSVLMESAPAGINPLEVEKDLLTISTIEAIHDLHIWSVSQNKVALSVHLVSDNSSNLLENVHHLIQSKYPIHHMTIQIEDSKTYAEALCSNCDEH